MNKPRIPLIELNTYVFVDTSNIRSACIRTLGFNIDFKKFLVYLRKKYHNLKDVYYYEGISSNDLVKAKEFNRLQKLGYNVRTLSRKAYANPAVYKQVKCRKCGNEWKTQVLKKTLSLKSNVDVYLATDLLKLAYFVNQETHIILVSCDGDYAEMIKSAIETNPNVLITVIGTPVVKNHTNTFSMRLQNLNGHIPHFTTSNIKTIQGLIEQE